MKNAKKLGLVGRIFLAAGALFSGGCIDEYAAGGAAMQGFAQMSRTPRGAIMASAVEDAISRTGEYKAAERAGAAGASQTNVYVEGSGTAINASNPTVKNTEVKKFDYFSKNGASISGYLVGENDVNYIINDGYNNVYVDKNDIVKILPAN